MVISFTDTLFTSTLSHKYFNCLDYSSLIPAHATEQLLHVFKYLCCNSCSKSYYIYRILIKKFTLLLFFSIVISRYFKSGKCTIFKVLLQLKPGYTMLDTSSVNIYVTHYSSAFYLTGNFIYWYLVWPFAVIWE